MLDDKDESVRAEAARSLKYFNDVRVIDRLILALNDTDTDVRGSAILLLEA